MRNCHAKVEELQLATRYEPTHRIKNREKKTASVRQNASTSNEKKKNGRHVETYFGCYLHAPNCFIMLSVFAVNIINTHLSPCSAASREEAGRECCKFRAWCTLHSALNHPNMKKLFEMHTKRDNFMLVSFGGSDAARLTVWFLEEFIGNYELCLLIFF